jgi:hypothetical protein
MLDTELVLVREAEIQIDVALRVDDSRYTGGLVSDDVGGVREALQVELLENQMSTPVTAS